MADVLRAARAADGRLVPPTRLDSILEYTHRAIAGLTGLLVAGSTAVGWRRYRATRWLYRPPAVAIVLLLAVAMFGAVVVLRGLAPGFALLDLGSALSVLGLMVVTTVVAFRRHADPGLPDHLSFSAPLPRLGLWALVLTFGVLVSGVLVAAPGSAVRCLGWPLSGAGLDVTGARRWLAVGRLLLTVLATVLIAVLAARTWLTRRTGSAGRPGLALGLLLAANVVAAALAALLGSPVWLLLVAVVLAAALWTALVALVVLLALPASLHALALA